MTLTGTVSTVALVAAAGIVAAVSVSSPGDQGSEAVTLTGCLRTGGTPAVYILRGAGAAPDAPQPSGAALPAAAEDYLLVQIPASIKLAEMVNHRAAITGLVSDAKSGPAPPSDANAAERALKRLSVQSARDVAPNCSGG
jgi:hypothetical protein